MIADLVAIQTAHRWSDKTMAERLGITRVHWLRIRRGISRPGRKVFVGVVHAFPELEGQAIAYLRRM